MNRRERITPSPVYIVVNCLDTLSGEAWDKFMDWSKLVHLRDVVSFDQVLCPSAIEDLRAEDWKHNVNADYRIFFFRDLAYLLSRVDHIERRNILALVEEPSEADLAAQPSPGFIFRGFDVVDVCCDISALTCCCGFDKAFQSSDLSRFGLLDDIHQAYDIRERLQREHAGEDHTDCLVWGIWRMEGCECPPSA